MTEWYELGQAVMKTARNRRGLSYEAVSRQLHVSAKTYERWEKAGRVPVGDLDAVAEALDLEIERPARQRVNGPDLIAAKSPEDLRRLLAAEVARYLDLNEQLEERLRASEG